MAQLIKLNDYISRYETDLSRYTSLFVRLKKRRWDSMLEYEIKNQSAPNEVEDLKRTFLDQLFISQIKWASSTITEKSYPHSSLYSDVRLRKLLQRFPDTFLLMYNPIFQLKKAKVQLEVIMVTPSKVICMSFLDDEDNAFFIGSQEHFWQKKTQNGENKVLNPIISVRRMDKVIKQIFQTNDTELPIEKVIIAENGYITHQNPPDDVRFIDKQNYETWLTELKSYNTPLKMMQFRAARALLEKSVRTSVRRSYGVGGSHD
ncbi:hydrolase [Bacillus freudenreichii]|nr:hydrolase [Bacillus freudenreichii]